MDEIDIYRAARRLLDQHGPLAVDRALHQIRRHCVTGDMDGCAVWARIVAAVNELRRAERCASEPVN